MTQKQLAALKHLIMAMYGGSAEAMLYMKASAARGSGTLNDEQVSIALAGEDLPPPISPETVTLE